MTRSMLDPLVDRVAALAAEVRGLPHFEWGTITSVAPLRVRLDGDEAPLLGTPSTLVKFLAVGDRVQVVIQNRRPTIVGTTSSALVDESAWTRERARHVASNLGTGRTYFGGRAGQDGPTISGGAYLGMNPDATGNGDVAWFIRNGVHSAGFTADGGLNMPKLPYAMASGVASISAGGSGSSITFPSGRFNATPRVMLMVHSTTNNVVSVPWYGALSASGLSSVTIFTLGGARVAGEVIWIAVQMTKTAGSG